MTETFLFHADARDVADEGAEIDIQSRFIRRLRKVAPSIKVVGIPNGGKRTAWEKLNAKREGLHAGWPDVTCYWSHGIDGSAVPGQALLEFKDRRGRLSDEQIASLSWLHRHGFACGMFRSVDTAIAFLQRSGAPFLIEREAA